MLFSSKHLNGIKSFRIYYNHVIDIHALKKFRGFGRRTPKFGEFHCTTHCSLCHKSRFLAQVAVPVISAVQLCHKSGSKLMVLVTKAS